MKLLVDFWPFPRISQDLFMMIPKLFLFDFHISAEQFYDHNKQELYWAIYVFPVFDRPNGNLLIARWWHDPITLKEAAPDEQNDSANA